MAIGRIVFKILKILRYIHVIDTNDVQNRPVLIPERVSMNAVCNRSGIQLLDICHSTDLRIVNGRIGSDAAVGILLSCPQQGSV